MEKLTGKLIEYNGNTWHKVLLIESQTLDPANYPDRRAVVTIGSENWECALMPAGAGTFFINLNKARLSKLGLKTGSSIDLKLAPSTSEYGMEVSEEFQAVLESSAEYAIAFQKLTKGKQRTLIHLSSTVKNTDKRIRRSQVILDHLVNNESQVDFKQLNEEIKFSNRQGLD